MTHLDSWDLASTWSLYTSPARPNPSEVTIVNKIIKENSQVLLLGSTPEYRDLLSQKSCHTTIVDYSRDNFDAMTRLMAHTPANETFIENDWRHISTTQSFDYIIGDHIINLIPANDWNVLLNLLKQLLNPHGQLIQRVIIRPDDVIPHAKQHFLNLKKTAMQADFSHTFYHLLLSTLNSHSHTTCLQDAWRLVQQGFDEGWISKIQHDFFNALHWQESTAPAYFPQKNELIKQFSRHFKENTVQQGDIYYKDLTFFVISALDT